MRVLYVCTVCVYCMSVLYVSVAGTASRTLQDYRAPRYILVYGGVPLMLQEVQMLT